MTPMDNKKSTARNWTPPMFAMGRTSNLVTITFAGEFSQECEECVIDATNKMQTINTSSIDWAIWPSRTSQAGGIYRFGRIDVCSFWNVCRTLHDDRCLSMVRFFRLEIQPNNLFWWNPPTLCIFTTIYESIPTEKTFTIRKQWDRFPIFLRACVCWDGSWE